MTRSLKALALATILTLCLAPLAMAESNDPVDPAIDAKIREQLTVLGYEVRSITTENGMYEVYAMKDGKKIVVALNEKLEIVDNGDSN